MRRTRRPPSRRAPRPAALAALVIAVTGARVARAADVAPADLKLQTRIVSVALFKNGLGFVAREGEFPRGASAAAIQGLPAPALGTFWISAAPGEATVQNAVASMSETSERVEAISVDELLRANVGETVEIRFDNDKTLRGRILPGGVRAAVPPGGSESERFAPPVETSSLLLLQTSGGMVAMSRNTIQQVASVNGPLKTSIERPRRDVSVRVHGLNSGGRGRIFVQYLAKGITWAPSFAIDISDPKRARVTSKAEVLDEIEDLDDATVSFVTGYPNLRFADLVDPIALRGDLATFLGGLARTDEVDRLRGSVLAQQSLAMNAAADREMFPAYSPSPGAGETREELFFYEQKGVTLKRGERGYYPLFTIEAPYEHLYEWSIGDALDEQEQYRARDDANTDKAEDVWHSIRLTNTGSLPWTTAPAMTMQEGRILGQDALHYTSPGAKTTLRITKAVDIQAERAEFEAERTRNAANFYGYSYDLVEVHGKLDATNYKDKPVTLTIRKELSGEVLRSAPVAKVEQTARGLKKVNPRAVLTWEIPIKAREKAEIEYAYKVYVRD